MADLHNLLDQIEDFDEDAPHGEDDEEQETIVASGTQAGSQDWDDGEREELEIPDALKEFEQKKLNPDLEQDSDAEEEALEDVQAVQKESASLCYSRLKKLWLQEIACPELLPLDEEMINEATVELQIREESLEQLSEEEGDLTSLLESVRKVDMDRAKFILNDLFRIRLSKIQEHPLHMRNLVDRMSENEIVFLKGYGQLLEGHLRRTVLDHIAKVAFRNLDEPEMVDSPDLDQYVFVKVKEKAVIDTGTEDDSFPEEHQAGKTLITRYSVVRDSFAQGKVELLL